MRDRRLRRWPAGRPAAPRGTRPARAPRLRLGRHRRARPRARRAGSGSPRGPAGCATWPSRLPKRFAGKVGIGHTRWATHGPANDVNAHPHIDAKGDVAVVHNGIIDNAAALRAELTDAGCRPRLRHRHRGARPPGRPLRGRDPRGQGQRGAGRIEGTYGLAVLHADFPDRIVVARNGSPLIIGVGDKEMHVASDLAALVRYTTRSSHLDDGELATLTADRLHDVPRRT